MSLDTFLSVVADTCAELQIDPAFLLGLLKEDDWSFVIKCHALVEGAVTHALVQTTGDERLRDFYRALPLNNRSTGKLAVAIALEVLEPWHLRFIPALSAIRNTLVHDAANVGFTFPGYVSALSRARLEELGRACAMADVVDKASLARSIDMLRAQPKYHFWILTVFLLSRAYLQAQKARLATERARLDADLARSASAVLGDVFDGLAAGQLPFKVVGHALAGPTERPAA